jgi:hypothetical protein
MRIAGRRAARFGSPIMSTSNRKYQEANERGELNYDHPDHAPARTRREFLGRSAATMSTLWVPSILSLVSARAQGQTAAQCVAATTTDTFGIPVICFGLNGGYHSAKNVPIGGPGGAKLSDDAYRGMGLDTSANPNNLGLDTTMGVGFYPRSPLLAGMKSAMTAPTIANTRIVAIAQISNDDSSQNPYNWLGWLHRAGFTQGSLTSMIGNSDTASKARSVEVDGSFDSGEPKALVTGPGSITSLISAAALTQNFKQDEIIAILKASNKMSSAQLAAFANRSFDAQMKQLVECGLVAAQGQVANFDPAKMLPSADPDLAAIFTGNEINSAEATAAFMVFNGYASCATLDYGGHDYHGNALTATNAKDQDSGARIGRVIEAAAKKQKKFFFDIYSDGAIGVNTSSVPDPTLGEFQAGGDSGTHCVRLIGIYDPAGPVNVLQTQLGEYNNAGQVAPTATPFANSVTNASMLVFANLMWALGADDKIAKAIPNLPFDAKYKAFG